MRDSNLFFYPLLFNKGRHSALDILDYDINIVAMIFNPIDKKLIEADRTLLYYYELLPQIYFWLDVFYSAIKEFPAKLFFKKII
jgi:hypothetical protein